MHASLRFFSQHPKHIDPSVQSLPPFVHPGASSIRLFVTDRQTDGPTARQTDCFSLCSWWESSPCFLPNVRLSFGPSYSALLRTTRSRRRSIGLRGLSTWPMGSRRAAKSGVYVCQCWWVCFSVCVCWCDLVCRCLRTDMSVNVCVDVSSCGVCWTIVGV